MTKKIAYDQKFSSRKKKLKKNMGPKLKYSKYCKNNDEKNLTNNVSIHSLTLLSAKKS